MRMPFALRHALRESRSTWRRLGLYMGSITLGVAALVAINSFRTNILASVQIESRKLLGADLELHSSRIFPDSVDALLDSLDATVPVSWLTSTPSMAVDPATGNSRLAQIKALEGGYPYYGEITTEPASAWGRLSQGRHAVADPALGVQLDVAVGDSIQIGRARFLLTGFITSSPGEISFQSAIGPRIYIPAQYLGETDLIQFGSLVQYQAFVKIDDNPTLQSFLNHHEQFFRDHQVRYDTVAERVEDLTFAIENMTRFLGLVGLVALLLGGVGVASAVHVFIKEKLDTVAVLRCLGARQRSVFAAYLVQAMVLGLAGAAAGVVLGILIQKILPLVLGDFIPLQVNVRIDWLMIGAGLVIGVWVAGIFAFLPLLSIWNVTPLRALRREFEAVTRQRTPWRRLAYLALAVSVGVISVWQAPFAGAGLAFGGGVAVTAGLLWFTARLLIRLTRRHFPRRSRYVIRQGVANLFRPQNQTVAVTIALGFGVFMIATIYVVQRNILDRFDLDAEGVRPNLVTLDIQTDQRDGVRDIFERNGESLLQATAIVPARIRRLNGRTVDEVLADTSGPAVARWALRREYRHTYRDTLVQTEELVAGAWWPDAPESDVARVSLEEDIARELQVGLGDRITWDVQGVEIESEIVSLRRVNWARFEPNFFAVFEPAALAGAPQTTVAMARVVDGGHRIAIQRDLVRAFPNVTVVDLGLIQQALDDILGKVTLAIRFMALFSIAAGVVVLIGAIGTSRYHRIRESVLLKTLGASRRQIGQIFSTEYAALGTLAGLTGILLATVAGWLLIRFLFELEFRIPGLPLAALWAGVMALTTGIGLLSSRGILSRPPLAIIREIAD